MNSKWTDNGFLWAILSVFVFGTGGGISLVLLDVTRIPTTLGYLYPAVRRFPETYTFPAIVATCFGIPSWYLFVERLSRGTVRIRGAISGVITSIGSVFVPIFFASIIESSVSGDWSVLIVTPLMTLFLYAWSIIPIGGIGGYLLGRVRVRASDNG